jgi:hypothetical protein
MHVDDPREAAAQYRLDRLRRDEARRNGEDPDAGAQQAADTTPAPTAAERAAYVETVIQQAIRRGDFDDLPGSGKPLQLGHTHDPDWWIRRKIQSEKLRGLGPPALTLRVEGAELADRLDEHSREADVREHVTDFNRRVVEARRQLLGGPPVVTPTRDVEAEVTAWRERRAARVRATADARAAEDADSRARRRWAWRQIRRASRGAEPTGGD